MHRVATIDEGTDLILVDRVQLHERTGAVALRSLAAAGRGVMAPRPAFVTMDHVVDTHPGRTDATLIPSGTAFSTPTPDADKAAGPTPLDHGYAAQGHRTVHPPAPRHLHHA